MLNRILGGGGEDVILPKNDINDFHTSQVYLLSFDVIVFVEATVVRSVYSL